MMETGPAGVRSPKRHILAISVLLALFLFVFLHDVESPSAGHEAAGVELAVELHSDQHADAFCALLLVGTSILTLRSMRESTITTRAIPISRTTGATIAIHPARGSPTRPGLHDFCPILA